MTRRPRDSEVKANSVTQVLLSPVEKSDAAKQQTKIIFTIWNNYSPRREIFRTLCNSYLESLEQAVEKLFNYQIPE